MPSVRSWTETQSSRCAQRVAYRSQRRVAAASAPSTAAKDQACGWKTVGTAPRTASRPASPALALCRWSMSGAAARTIRRSRQTSAAVAGPGERPAGQSWTSAPTAAASSASRPPRGQATSTR